jgi:uncharacterized phage infection (PIP) family protein YhgE
MKKFAKADVARIAELVQDLQDKASQVTSAVEAANARVSEANDAITAYNEVLSEVESFRDEMVGKMEDYVGERSEKWQESDAASSYQDWQSEWENIDIAEVTPIEDITIPDMDHGSELEGLATEVSS